ncbi:3-hydroxyacyl-CoA dehydrogenase [Acidianus sulfidivorans]|nr:3-hydroxyacyl-CoA dehydrogenase [Acidianus sulfidivorans]
MRIKKFSVIGAGTMGHGIAELAAISGYEVWLNDINDEILNNAMNKIKWSLEQLEKKKNINPDEVLSRIHTTSKLEEALKDTDFMVEAVIEDIKMKSEIFSKADKLSEGILATNTSSLPISEIAEAAKNRKRIVGMHFFNPPVLMPLIEIIKGKETSDETIKITYEVSKSLGKEPVIAKKDIPGFIVTRILFRLLENACYLVESGKATIEDVDYSAKKELGFPMGVFLLQDNIGIDVDYFIMNSMIKRGFEMYNCNLIKQKFENKEYGLKTGKGFYVHPAKIIEGKKEVDPKLIISSAVNEAFYLLKEDVASKEDIDKSCKLGLGWPKGIFEYAKELGLDEIRKTLEELKKETKLEHFTPQF